MVFIVAELGVNFRNLHEAKRMIGLAKHAGADAVKFQVFQDAHIRGHPREKELENIILERPYLEHLKETADSCGIEFIATPMFPEAVDWLEAIKVKRYKIRYADNKNVELIDKVTKTNKPMMISCDGDALIDERLHDLLIKHRTIWMYCVPEYPPSKAVVPGGFDIFKGYSSHYPSIIVPLVAAARGAQYIEVHVKMDRYDPPWTPIDDAVSITFPQLGELVKYVREVEKIVW